MSWICLDLFWFHSESSDSEGRRFCSFQKWTFCRWFISYIFLRGFDNLFHFRLSFSLSCSRLSSALSLFFLRCLLLSFSFSSCVLWIVSLHLSSFFLIFSCVSPNITTLNSKIIINFVIIIFRQRWEKQSEVRFSRLHLVI